MRDGHFNRITCNPQVVAGQACIRDTGIPVYEVVRLAAAGRNVAEIVYAWPALEPEDVHQAMAYAVQELSEIIYLWKYEGLEALTLIQGRAALLASTVEEAMLQGLTAQNRQEMGELVEALNRHVAPAIASWNHLLDWLDLCHRPPLTEPPKRRTLPEIMDAATQALKGFGGNKSFDVVLPAELPPVRASRDLGLALAHLP
jgi:uncharacterized protein (DUF433 family)